MKFIIVKRTGQMPSFGKNTVYLRVDNWNDFSFVTQFGMSLHDENGEFINIGVLKIGYKGQTVDVDTHVKIGEGFERLSEDFFSLGLTSEFYKNINLLSKGNKIEILKAIRDIVSNPEIIDDIGNEKVFSTSFLRGISLSVIKGQFARVLDGKAELTDYKFKYVRPEMDEISALDLSFNVLVGSMPSTNIHAIIGRNGVGKTTLLNGMISAVTTKRTASKFLDCSGWDPSEIEDDYFSSLVSVSFSAFDPFNPPQEQSNPSNGTCYFYIGLKDRNGSDCHRTISELRDDCVTSLIACFYKEDKTRLWIDAIDKLGSDENFSSMNLNRLHTAYTKTRRLVSMEEQSDSDKFKEEYKKLVIPYLEYMSSGHAIVLLTITRLVATVEEKTLVLLDEPESHLHPPLLSAFIRALADLLHDKNGVALIATHSPVILQEIPRSCVWKIYRSGDTITCHRPNIETFGENLGVLTSEVFSLEVERSGFHDLLASSVKTGQTYDKIVENYKGQLGFEARAILKSLVAHRDRSIQNDAS